MKIDTHQHFWRYRAEAFPWISEAMPALRRDRLPTDVAPALEAAGVTGVVAIQARCDSDETDFLLDLADHYPKILGVVGWADLAAPDLSERIAQWSAHSAFKGLRHILQDEADVADWVGQSDINQGLATAQKAGLVYDVLVFDRQLHDVVGLCARHSAHWLVLDHVGKPAVRDWAEDAEVAGRWRKGILALAAMPHVVCKLSGLVTEADWAEHDGVSTEDAQTMLACFDFALEAFGPQRLMYGSDWPVCQLSAPYADVHGLADRWAQSRLSANEQAAFWAGNARRYYDLRPPVLVV
jgi:L-fuconolactonase